MNPPGLWTIAWARRVETSGLRIRAGDPDAFSSLKQRVGRSANTARMSAYATLAPLRASRRRNPWSLTFCEVEGRGAFDFRLGHVGWAAFVFADRGQYVADIAGIAGAELGPAFAETQLTEVFGAG